MIVPAEQERLAREGAGLFELTDWSILELTGPDRAAYLHSFCTQDIQNLPAGEVREAFVTNVKGRILGHILAVNTGERLLLIAVPQAGPAMLRHLSLYLLGRNAEIRDASSSISAALLIGPHALAASRGTAAAGICLAPCPILSIPAVLLTGASTAMIEAINQLSATGTGRIGPETFELLRIEAGFPWHGRDISDDHLAQEAARTSQAIHFRKGCYLGQEPIARLDAMGHTNRELRLIGIERIVDVPVNTLVRAGDAEIGQVTSVVCSELQSKTLALGMLKVRQSQPGAQVEIATSPACTGTVLEFNR